MTDQSKPSLLQLGLFTGKPQHEIFPKLRDLLPSSKMTPAEGAVELLEGEPIALPENYQFDNKTKQTEDFFVETDTAGLLVLKDGAIRHERYALTGGRDVRWISWSVSKSIISALVGIAVEEGLISSIDDPISNYISVLPGSAYEGVSIKNVLMMCSGARWKEDYSDPTSDIMRLGAVMGGMSTLDEFVAGMVAQSKPGEVCRYNSGDTQALGYLLAAATKKSITDYMQEKLFEPLGMTSPGYWILDRVGREMAFAGVNLTARDFARIGELFRNGGVWLGKQLVPKSWVRDSIASNVPNHPIVGGHPVPMGYGYQWWIPEGENSEFSAIGIYNQFVYVDPSRGIVIVKLSSNRKYGMDEKQSTNREMETIAFFRSIAQSFD